MSNIQSRDISYQAGDVPMQGFLTWDAAASGPRPGMLVVHEFWGLNDYARHRATLLAELGYTALAADLFGNGRNAADKDEAVQLMNKLTGDMPECRSRFKAALDFLKAQDTVDETRTGAIGYCMGGGIVLHMARYGLDLDVVASFHGSLPLAIAADGEGAEVTARVVAYNGEDDVFVSAEAIADFKAEMEQTGADYQFIQLPGALHGFSNPAATAKGEKFDLPLRYDALADQCSWAHMQLLLKSVFNG